MLQTLPLHGQLDVVLPLPLVGSFSFEAYRLPRSFSAWVHVVSNQRVLVTMG